MNSGSHPKSAPIREEGIDKKKEGILEKLNKARKSLINGEYEQAIEQFESILEILEPLIKFGTDPDYRLINAVVHFDLGQEIYAKKFADSFLQASIGDRVLEEKRDTHLTKAVEGFERIVNVYSDPLGHFVKYSAYHCSTAHFFLGRYYKHQYKPSQAVAHFMMSIKVEPNPASYFQLGLIYKNGDLDTEKRHREGYWGGWRHWTVNPQHTKLAIENFKKAIKLDPQDFDSYYELKRTLSDGEADFSEVTKKDLYDAIEMLDPKSQVSLFQAALKDNTPLNARFSEQEGAAPCRIDRGTLKKIKKRKEQLEELINQQSEKSQDTPQPISESEAHYKRGENYFNEGKHQAAIEEFETAKKKANLSKGSSDHLIVAISEFCLGHAYARVNNGEEANKSLSASMFLLRSIIESDCTNLHIDAYYYYGVYLYAMGEDAPAIFYLEKVLKVHPKQADVHYQLARIYMESGDFPKMKNHCVKAISIGHQKTYQLLRDYLSDDKADFSKVPKKDLFDTIKMLKLKHQVSLLEKSLKANTALNARFSKQEGAEPCSIKKGTLGEIDIHLKTVKETLGISSPSDAHYKLAASYDGGLYSKDLPKKLYHCKKALELNPGNKQAYSMLKDILNNREILLSHEVPFKYVEKEDLYKTILTLDREDQISLLEKSLKPGTALHRRFSKMRGLYECSTEKGILKEIYDQKEKLVSEQKKELGKLKNQSSEEYSQGGSEFEINAQSIPSENRSTEGEKFFEVSLKEKDDKSSSSQENDVENETAVSKLAELSETPSLKDKDVGNQPEVKWLGGSLKIEINEEYDPCKNSSTEADKLSEMPLKEKDDKSASSQESDVENETKVTKLAELEINKKYIPSENSNKMKLFNVDPTYMWTGKSKSKPWYSGQGKAPSLTKFRKQPPAPENKLLKDKEKPQPQVRSPGMRNREGSNL